MKDTVTGFGRWCFRLRPTIPMGVLMFLTGFLLATETRAGDQQASELPQQARAVFQRYCFECHGKDGSDEGGMDYVTDLVQLVTRGKVKPNEPDKSRVMIRLRSSDDPMPPTEITGADRPQAAAVAIIENWIKAGAATVVEPIAVSEPPRAPVMIANVIATIHSHLSRLEPEDRPYQRYFVLNHLHNQPPEKVPAVQLRSLRAATSKVLNSLSWRFEIVVPKPLDGAQTVLAIDTRDIDWDADASTGRPDLWLHLVSRYPYALKHDRYPDDRGTRQMAEEIYNWTGIDISCITRCCMTRCSRIWLGNRASM